jgi:ribosomal protein L36
MAEAALYANYSEPQFPFEAAVPALQWVVPYVESLTAKKRRQCYHAAIFQDLLNILLVFTRARTSALLSTEVLEPCSKFIEKLNFTLLSLPVKTGAVHHEIQLVYRRRRTVFVVCKRSPRFIWNRTLSHRDVGFNLDFCGAGHINIRESVGVGTFAFHGSDQYYITHEAVYLDGVNDLTPIKEHFNKRTALFNETMNRLGMPYRFAHF